MRNNVILGSALALFVQAGMAHADGWRLLPVTGADYTMEPTLSVVGGQLDPREDNADSGSVAGIELSMNCPLLAAPGGTIRQQLSVTRYDEDGVELTSIEINPHYLVALGEGFSLGFGPGLGYVRAEAGNQDDSVFGLQFGASAQYRMGALYLGAEARWQWTEETDFDADVDNSRLMAKVGFNF